MNERDRIVQARTEAALKSQFKRDGKLLAGFNPTGFLYLERNIPPEDQRAFAEWLLQMLEEGES